MQMLLEQDWGGGRAILKHRDLRRERRAKSLVQSQTRGRVQASVGKRGGLMWDKCACTWKGQASSQK